MAVNVLLLKIPYPLLNLENFMIPCLFKTLFGIECLGCGLQRAIVLLFKGDFIGAFYRYPGIYMLFVFIGILISDTLFKNKNRSKPLYISGILTVVFIVSGYIYKNL